ncbi:MAG: DNA recombination protein RmuC, partial [Hyphomicrobiales bacterium]
MDKVLVVVADIPVTLEMALYGAAALVAALLFALVVTILRQSALRHEATLEAAAASAEQLRANFTELIADRDSRIRDLDRALLHERQRADHLVGEERDKNGELRSELAAMRTRLDEQARQNEMNLKRFVDARQQMTDEFKLIAGEVLQTHSETFTKQNREQVDVLLKPLHEKITEFHQGLIKDRSAMSEQIRALAESNLQITTEAHNLTRALKGNSQTQGAWGEMILSTILEQSGLREGEQFITQTSHSGEDGQRVRTDVEVLMPNNDRLIIDSKVSLTAFEAFVNAEDETREMHLRAHIASVRNHITTLGDKAYHRAAKSSMDYVMMFVPIESAVATAIQNDVKLVEFGMSRGVMLTTPTTLMTVLRTIRNVWDIERRHRNADEIAARAGALYDKVAGFLATMDRVGGH